MNSNEEIKFETILMHGEETCYVILKGIIVVVDVVINIIRIYKVY